MLKQVTTLSGHPVEIWRMVIDETSNNATTKAELVSPQRPYRSFQATVTGTNAVAVVDIEVSVDGVSWMKALTLTTRTGVDDGMSDLSPWPYVRAVVTRNTGTLNVTMGC